jgi:hypothetical protein
VDRYLARPFEIDDLIEARQGACRVNKPPPAWTLWPSGSLRRRCKPGAGRPTARARARSPATH